MEPPCSSSETESSLALVLSVSLAVVKIQSADSNDLAKCLSETVMSFRSEDKKYRTSARLQALTLYPDSKVLFLDANMSAAYSSRTA